jgi:alpha,alpha-trehalose phosphorylase
VLVVIFFVSGVIRTCQSLARQAPGYDELALRYLFNALLMDLGDVSGNLRDGCHIASMGGT